MLGHTTKAGSHSSSAQYTETNKGGCQNKETKKHGPNERADQNSRKRTKQNGDKQSSDAEFKILVIRMLKELNEDLKSIKKI